MLHTSLCPSSGYLTNAGPEGEPVNSDFVGEYEDIFIKVIQWHAFEESDMVGNDIYICGEVAVRVPDVVTDLLQKLDYKPGLAADVCYFLDHSFDTDGSI